MTLVTLAPSLADDRRLRDTLRRAASGTPGWASQTVPFLDGEDRRRQDLAARVSGDDQDAYEQAADLLLSSILPRDRFSADIQAQISSQPGALSLLDAFCHRMIRLAWEDDEWKRDLDSLHHALGLHDTLGLGRTHKVDGEHLHQTAVEIVAQIAASPARHTAPSLIRHSHEAMIRAQLDQLAPLISRAAHEAGESPIHRALGEDLYGRLIRRRFRTPHKLARFITPEKWECIVRAALTDSEHAPALPAPSARHLIEKAVRFGLENPAAFGEF